MIRTVLILGCLLVADSVIATVETKPLVYPKLVQAFYESNGNQEVWKTPKLLQQLQDAIGEAPLHGLRLENYHYQELAIQPERLITDAFFTYAHDLWFGRASHTLKGRDWNVTHNDLQLIAVLQRAVSNGEIRKELLALAPSNTAYRSLQSALMEYRRLAVSGGWQTFNMPVDREGELLRQRLELTKDLWAGMQITDGVIKFQRRHGLKPDGIIGRETTAALNVSVDQKIQQLELSLERLRWMPHEFSARAVVVNVPAFDLRIFENGEMAQMMRVIVGKTTWCTPTFLASEVNQIVINPYWYVPSIIASKEIFPLVKKDPRYMERNNLRMISRADGSLQLRQSPGPQNSLGRIKFLFPNCCDCYLHDTPEKQLFDKLLRLFSHGCIRVERAVDLANWILAEDGWSAEQLDAAIESNKTQTIRLTNPTPIFLVYFTAWVEQDGSVQFRDDVYKKDSELLVGLQLAKQY